MCPRAKHEGIVLVFLEAMAEGLPVVCCDFGGQSDFLQDRRSGRLIALNDINEIIRGVRELINNNDEISMMGTANRTRVENVFIDVCASRYEKIFEEVVFAAKSKL